MSDGNVDQFMADLHELCVKHNLVLDADAFHTFIIRPWSAKLWEQLQLASIDVTALHPSVQQQIKDAVSGN